MLKMRHCATSVQSKLTTYYHAFGLANVETVSFTQSIRPV